MEISRDPEVVLVDLAELVRQEIVEFVPAALVRKIEIALDTPDRLAVSLEVHPFRSILQNLLDNAIRYGREGGKVAVGLASRGTSVTLSVSDDGPGIANADGPRVFERFYRGVQRNDAAGTGLGLTIVTQATARLGGDVRVTKGLYGRGCCFTVEIAAALRPTQQRE